MDGWCVGGVWDQVPHVDAEGSVHSHPPSQIISTNTDSFKAAGIEALALQCSAAHYNTVQYNVPQHRSPRGSLGARRGEEIMIWCVRGCRNNRGIMIWCGRGCRNKRNWVREGLQKQEGNHDLVLEGLQKQEGGAQSSFSMVLKPWRVHGVLGGP